ncbi:MAG: hypothetical protein J6X89_06350 [Bacteroidales bacterium]|nr:hypothetical protein [Bacteroidales bacterium]
MKKYTLLLTIVLAAMVCSPACQDISGLENDVNSLKEKYNTLEQRVAALEKATSNIDALQAAVNTLQGYDFVTAVNEIKEGDAVVGYEIAFNKAGNRKIYNGKDGAAGKDAPVIGVIEGDDHLYYWTLDGTVIKGADGKPLQAGAQDGITPELKIEGGDWYVRYGTGEWKKYGKATGDNGANGAAGKDGDTWFSSVTVSNNSLTLVLASTGQKIVIPISTDLAITFTTPGSVTTTPGSTVEIGYTITSATGAAEIDAIPTSGVKAKVAASGLTGKINVVITAALDYQYDKVTVIVTNGKSTVLKKITFNNGGQIIISDVSTALLTYRGGNASFNYSSDVDCQVAIEQSAASWVAHTSTKALKAHTVFFSVAQNNTSSNRTAHISVWNPGVENSADFTIVQYGKTGSFAVTYTGTSASAVSIQGSNLSGLVDWGDQVEQWSNGITHTYAVAGQTAEYYVNNLQSFSLASLSGVSGINVKDINI